MTKGAIFDLDGVLLDSMGIWNDLGARYLRSRGLMPEPGLNEILFSMSMEQGAEYLHTHYPLAQSAAEIEAGIETMLRDFYYNAVRKAPQGRRRRAGGKGHPDGGGDLQPARACDPRFAAAGAARLFCADLHHR